MLELRSPGDLGLQGPHHADLSFLNFPLEGADFLQITKLSKVIRATSVPQPTRD